MLSTLKSKIPEKVLVILRYYLNIITGLFVWLNITLKTLLNRLTRLFIPIYSYKNSNGKTLLHLGCGKVNKDKFINIDGFPYPHVHYVKPIDKLSYFPNASIDLIYACHCLEHFSYLKTESVLREWFRVLKIGGVLRLSVPDLDKLVRIYQTHNNDPEVILPQLMGGQNNKYNYHLTAFNMVNLTRHLELIGFSFIQKWHPGSEELTTFDDLSTYRKEVYGESYEISLNIEATK